MSWGCDTALYETAGAMRAAGVRVISSPYEIVRLIGDA